MSAILDDDEDVLAGNTGERTLRTSGWGRQRSLRLAQHARSSAQFRLEWGANFTIDNCPRLDCDWDTLELSWQAQQVTDLITIY